jgi:heat shock protein beta
MEKFEFQAEVSRLMDIIINSLYKQKDIFLRELISNGSDALDKIRFMALQDESVLGEGDDKKQEILISFDKDERSLTIRDRGVGMTKQDLIQNLGTVARSGTTQFVEALSSGADISLIGQFGVGFYSVYLVADKVRVTSKNNDDDQHVWESTADAHFSVAKDPQGNTLGRGTEVKLFLKEDAGEFLEQDKIKDLIKKYSEFITFPIYLKTSKTETKEVPIEEEEEEESDDDKKEGEDEEDDKKEGDDEEEDDEELEAEDEAEDEAPKTRTETITTWEDVHINDQPAIWTRGKDDISDDDYKQFYKSVAPDGGEPLQWSHFKAEGEIEFKSILYIPKSAPHDMYDNYYGKTASLRLYVRKVMITDEFEDLMPRYLSFVRGVVDSDDLPLNVSRETLQQHKVLKVMGKKLVRKTLEMLRKMAQKSAKGDEDEDEDKDEDAAEGDEDKKDEKKDDEESEYDQFWTAFGKNIKLGLIEDSSNKTKLSKLLRFHTSFDDGKKWWSLEDYVGRMKDFQKDIFYIAGESMEQVKESPFLERLKGKGIEVIFMTDPIDEYAVQNLTEFDGKKLKSATKEGLKFGDESETDKKREEIYEKTFKDLSEWFGKNLGSKVEKVVISNRLENTPSMLVTSQYGYSANMERIMKSQAFADPSRGAYMASKKTMEINPRHPIVVELNKRVAESADDEETTNLGWLLYDAALMQSGFTPDDPKAFAGRMYALMKTGLSLESLELEPEVEVPAEPAADAGDEEAEEEETDEDADAEGEDAAEETPAEEAAAEETPAEEAAAEEAPAEEAAPKDEL